MTNDKNTKIYDLEERTAKFGEDIIDFAKLLSKDIITTYFELRNSLLLIKEKVRMR